MELSNHAAVITRVSDQFADELRLVWKRFVAVARVMDSGRVHTAHETSSTWRANRTLAIRVRERNTFFDEPVDTQALQCGRDMQITLSTNGLVVLLLGLYPAALMSLCVAVFN